MYNAASKICAGKPEAFSSKEIDEFVELVIEGGEVSGNGLRDRVVLAHCIAFARTEEGLVGVGGLKNPDDSYRNGIQAKSGVTIAVDQFRFELGWVFVLLNARKNGISGQLCKTLVASSEGDGVFATSRVDNIGMHKTMIGLGFERIGEEWKSSMRDESLTLFVRRADKSPMTRTSWK